jgi:hypothetical protein
MFEKLFKKKRAGLLTKFDLWDWWEAEFSESEQSYLIESYRPMGLPQEGFSILTGGNTSIGNARTFLTQFAAFYNNKKDFDFALRIMSKAMEFPSAKMSPMDFHFDCYDRIKFFYPWRDKHPLALPNAIRACEEQIEAAEQSKDSFLERWGDIPFHSGYDQLAIILEKRKDFQGALDICKKGRSEGWSNDFDKRIARLERKLERV